MAGMKLYRYPLKARGFQHEVAVRRRWITTALADDYKRMHAKFPLFDTSKGKSFSFSGQPWIAPRMVDEGPDGRAVEAVTGCIQAEARRVMANNDRRIRRSVKRVLTPAGKVRLSGITIA